MRFANYHILNIYIANNYCLKMSLNELNCPRAKNNDDEECKNSNKHTT